MRNFTVSVVEDAAHVDHETPRDAIEKPPYLRNESQLWNAYVALEKSKASGSPAPSGQAGKRILTDLVSLVRFAHVRHSSPRPRHSRESGNPRGLKP